MPRHRDSRLHSASRRQALRAICAGALAGTPAFRAFAAESVTLPFANGERPLARYPQKRPLIVVTQRPPQLETPFEVYNEGIVTPAALSRDYGKYSFREWQTSATLSPGEHRQATRVLEGRSREDEAGVRRADSRRSGRADRAVSGPRLRRRRLARRRYCRARPLSSSCICTLTADESCRSRRGFRNERPLPAASP